MDQYIKTYVNVLQAVLSEREVQLAEVKEQLHNKTLEVESFCTKFATRETTLAELQVLNTYR